MRKILGVNISHHCSFAYMEDGVLKEYYEEDRFNKIKGFMPPEMEQHGTFDYNYEILKKFKDIEFDYVVICSYDRGQYAFDKPIFDNIAKQIKYKDLHFMGHNHHLGHAMGALYWSGWKNAIAVVMDGGGERRHEQFFQTMCSMYKFTEFKSKELRKVCSSKMTDYFCNFVDAEYFKRSEDVDYYMNNKCIAGQRYLQYMYDAGFEIMQEGQLMGLAAYHGKEIEGIDPKQTEIADKAQKELLEEQIEFIKQIKHYSEEKNILLSGGCFMNCSNNFKIVKAFPEYNFFVDPIAHDGGTAVGAAYFYDNYRRLGKGVN